MNMKYKNIVSVFLACTMLVCAFLPVGALDDLTATQDVFTYDHLWAIVGMQVLSEADNEETIWDEDSYIDDIIPLYDYNDEIMAYYVKMMPYGYMIINADVNNPDVLEFAYNHDNYRAVCTEYLNGKKIYYNGPRSLLTKEENEYYFIGDETVKKIRICSH